jgi:transposase-like protein
MDINQSPSPTPPPVTPQLKQAIIEMLLENKEVKTIAKQYHISRNTLYAWRKQAQKEKDVAVDESSLSAKELKEKLARSQKDLFESQQDVDVLKKALAILGKSTN